jgi:hypothetical protein
MFINCKFLLSAVLLFSLVLPVFSFEPSGGVLVLDGEDDYAILSFAEHGYIIPRGTNAFTVEVWFCPKAEPEPGKSNIILSQQVRFSLKPDNCRVPLGEKDQVCSSGAVFLEGAAQGIRSMDAAIKKDQWNYMAVIFKDSSFFIAYNDEILRTSRINRVNFVAADLRGPEQFKDFFVGGYAEDRVIFDNDHVEELGRRTHFHGLIDAIRFSNIARHDLPIAHGFWLFDPPQRFLNDEHTLALWDFNDEAGADRFEDTSGNGYTLIGMNGATTGSALAVNPKDTSITTTWGQIKLELF